MGFVINAIYSMAYGLHNMQRALCPGYQVGSALMDGWRDMLAQRTGTNGWKGAIMGRKDLSFWRCHITLLGLLHYIHLTRKVQDVNMVYTYIWIVRDRKEFLLYCTAHFS